MAEPGTSSTLETQPSFEPWWSAGWDFAKIGEESNGMGSLVLPTRCLLQGIQDWAQNLPDSRCIQFVQLEKNQLGIASNWVVDQQVG
jgi:hypothetical protein